MVSIILWFFFFNVLLILPYKYLIDKILINFFEKRHKKNLQKRIIKIKKILKYENPKQKFLLIQEIENLQNTKFHGSYIKSQLWSFLMTLLFITNLHIYFNEIEVPLLKTSEEVHYIEKVIEMLDTNKMTLSYKDISNLSDDHKMDLKLIEVIKKNNQPKFENVQREILKEFRLINNDNVITKIEYKIFQEKIEEEIKK